MTTRGTGFLTGPCVRGRGGPAAVEPRNNTESRDAIGARPRAFQDLGFALDDRRLGELPQPGLGPRALGRRPSTGARPRLISSIISGRPPARLARHLRSGKMFVSAGRHANPRAARRGPHSESGPLLRTDRRTLRRSGLLEFHPRGLGGPDRANGEATSWTGPNQGPGRRPRKPDRGVRIRIPRHGFFLSRAPSCSGIGPGPDGFRGNPRHAPGPTDPAGRSLAPSMAEQEPQNVFIGYGEEAGFEAPLRGGGDGGQQRSACLARATTGGWAEGRQEERLRRQKKQAIRGLFESGSRISDRGDGTWAG